MFFCTLLIIFVIIILDIRSRQKHLLLSLEQLWPSHLPNVFTPHIKVLHFQGTWLQTLYRTPTRCYHACKADPECRFYAYDDFTKCTLFSNCETFTKVANTTLNSLSCPIRRLISNNFDNFQLFLNISEYLKVLSSTSEWFRIFSK